LEDSAAEATGAAANQARTVSNEKNGKDFMAKSPVNMPILRLGSARNSLSERCERRPVDRRMHGSVQIFSCKTVAMVLKAVSNGPDQTLCGSTPPCRMRVDVPASSVLTSKRHMFFTPSINRQLEHSL
ncbi:MAG: hypothetical protein ABI478_10115, partial [Propionivibrio sp.]